MSSQPTTTREQHTHMSTDPDLSAAYVSGLLGKKHRRSESHSTRVRGYRRSTAGFRVWDSGTVKVEHVRGDTYRDRIGDYYDARDAYLKRYADTLRAAGLTVSLEALGTPYARLHVTRPSTTA